MWIGLFERAEKRAVEKAESPRVFGQARKPAKMFRAGLNACVSTNDQQTLAMQNRVIREEAARRGWIIALMVRECTPERRSDYPASASWMRRFGSCL